MIEIPLYDCYSTVYTRSDMLDLLYLVDQIENDDIFKITYSEYQGQLIASVYVATEVDALYFKLKYI